MTSPENSNRSLYVSADKIYPRQVYGLFSRLRILTVFLLLGLFYLSPWLTWDGHQAILFDLPARKFHLMGITFWPQDFVYLTLLLVISALGLFLFTAFAGRLWCGYSCPQTVWTQTFLWIEELVEGKRNQRIKLDKSPWTINKITRKSTKHLLWIAYSLFTGYTFVGYFSPIGELWGHLLSLSLGPWEWFWIGLYSLATYGNAGWLREQVCLHMCPYARFQSAMFDKDTLVISYDKNRGEGRGKRKKNSDYKAKGLGDCIDCMQCVHVCPTGIDIRDGLQYECIACAACIDVCDNVMEQMHYPKGLIQYTTEHAEQGVESKIFRPRTLLYIGLFSLLVSIFIYLVATRVPLDVNVIRDRNTLFTESFAGKIENTYQLKILNMSQQPHQYGLSVAGFEHIEFEGKKLFSIESGEVLTLPIRVSVPREVIHKRSSEIRFSIQSLDESELKFETTGRFIGPDPQSNRTQNET